MTNLFNPSIAIPVVWEMFEKFTTARLTGGAVSDAFYGKGSRDLDVFVSRIELDKVQLFAKYYKFEPVVTPERFREVEDSYGHMRRVRIGKQESDIVEVYKGYLVGYPVEIVVVQDLNVETHITTRFDQSVKACWFDGEYHYSDLFMETAATGVIEPIRNEASGYVRAWLSADKYDLEISSAYDLSKHYCAYAFKHDKLQDILSASTLQKIEAVKEDMFNFDVDYGNVVLLDVFMNHYREDSELYAKLCKIANKQILTRHPLAQTDIEVKLEASNLQQFKNLFYQVQNEVMYNMGEVDPQVRNEAAAHLQAFTMVHPESYAKGVTMDDNGREARIGKFMNKLQRKYKEVYGKPMVANLFNEALKLLENRSAATKAKVFFSGHKHALTHISTKTQWTSCQRWGGFGGSLPNNYGLIANVSGNTMVAYVADERSDTKSSKWKARVLIRVGADGSMILENVYSNRIEYQNNSLTNGIKEALTAKGFKVFSTRKEAMDFRSLPFWKQPYLDTSLVKLVFEHGMPVLKGCRKEVEREERINKLNKQLEELTKQTDIHFIPTSKYVRQAIVEIPAELQEEVAWAKRTSHWYSPGVSMDMVNPRYTWPSVQVEDIDDVYVIVISIEKAHRFRDERAMERYENIVWNETYRRNPGPQVVPWGPVRIVRAPGRAVPVAPIGMVANAVPAVRVVMPGADVDGDHDPFAVVIEDVENEDLPF